MTPQRRERLGIWKSLSRLPRVASDLVAEIFLWLSTKQARAIGDNHGEIKKVQAIAFPTTSQGEIWCGEKMF